MISRTPRHLAAAIALFLAAGFLVGCSPTPTSPVSQPPTSQTATDQTPVDQSPAAPAGDYCSLWQADPTGLTTFNTTGVIDSATGEVDKAAAAALISETTTKANLWKQTAPPNVQADIDAVLAALDEFKAVVDKGIPSDLLLVGLDVQTAGAQASASIAAACV